MKIHEFGKENNKHIILIHPSLVMWDYFVPIIPLLEKDYHLIIPALPGYNEESQEDFTSVEEIANELADWLNVHGYHAIDCLYGCSMGGAVVARMLADHKIIIHAAVIDGGITPYQLPRIVTRLIAMRDFAMVSMGKIGGIRLLVKVFSGDDFSRNDIQYMANIFKLISYKTIWRTFESCNNYSMPERIETNCKRIQYWFGDKEQKERKWDIRYIRKSLPHTKFIRMHNLDHACMVLQRPEKTAKRLRDLCQGE